MCTINNCGLIIHRLWVKKFHTNHLHPEQPKRHFYWLYPEDHVTYLGLLIQGYPALVPLSWGMTNLPSVAHVIHFTPLKQSKSQSLVASDPELDHLPLGVNTINLTIFCTLIFLATLINPVSELLPQPFASGRIRKISLRIWRYDKIGGWVTNVQPRIVWINCDIQGPWGWPWRLLLCNTEQTSNTQDCIWIIRIISLRLFVICEEVNMEIHRLILLDVLSGWIRNLVVWATHFCHWCRSSA